MPEKFAKVNGLLITFVRNMKIYMKKYGLWLLFLCVAAMSFQSCDHQKSYADMLKEERELIKRFIDKNNIEVITPEVFYAQDSTTHGNQYVLFKETGVYMHIVDKGKGRKAVDKDLITVRFMEENLANGDSISTIGMSAYLDEFRYTKSTNSVTGKFVDTQGGMYGTYGSAVPAGWLVPLDFIELSTRVSNRANVWLIVPAKMGQPDALQKVYPCFYKLFYQLPNH